MDLAAERTAAAIDDLLAAGVGPLFRFGGEEHATPPLMAPADFDDFLVRRDLPLMAAIKRAGRFVAVHCHSRLRHTLTRFVEMGVDMTDPVETLPDGDLSIEQARAIAADRVTLAGNIQVRKLTTMTPENLRVRVRELIDRAGPRRLIVTATGTPLEAIPPALEKAYHAMMDSVLEWGK